MGPCQVWPDKDFQSGGNTIYTGNLLFCLHHGIPFEQDAGTRCQCQGLLLGPCRSFGRDVAGGGPHLPSDDQVSWDSQQVARPMAAPVNVSGLVWVMTNQASRQSVVCDQSSKGNGPAAVRTDTGPLPTASGCGGVLRRRRPAFTSNLACPSTEVRPRSMCDANATSVTATGQTFAVVAVQPRQNNLECC